MNIIALPKVSIIIPVYNGSNYLKQAISSAIAQTYKNKEIIVVNDGSKDNGKTEQIALSFGDKIKYYAKENGGVATALNLGIEKMTGEYFSWLSHDDLYTKDKVKKQVEVLNGLDDKATIVICGYKVVNEYKEYLWRVNPYERYTQEQLDKPLFAVLRGLANGCGMLIHKSHFERVGKFDVNLPTTNDYDLWFRMMRDAKIKYHKGYYVLSRYHEAQDSKKISAHAKDCSDLWIWMMKEMTEQEMKNIDVTVHQFFQNTYLFLRDNSNYDSAIAYAYYRMLKELKVVSLKDRVYRFVIKRPKVKYQERNFIQKIIFLLKNESIAMIFKRMFRKIKRTGE